MGKKDNSKNPKKPKKPNSKKSKSNKSPKKQEVTLATILEQYVKEQHIHIENSKPEDLEEIIRKIVREFKFSEGSVRKAVSRKIGDTENLNGLSAEHWYNLGEQHRKITRDFNRAIDDYEKSIALQHNQFWSYFQKANCFKEQAFGEEPVNWDLASTAVRAYEDATKHFKYKNFDGSPVPNWAKFWAIYEIAEILREEFEENEPKTGVVKRLNRIKSYYKKAKRYVENIGEQEFWVFYHLAEIEIRFREHYKSRKQWGNAYHKRLEAVKLYKEAESKMHLLPESKAQFKFWTLYHLGHYLTRRDTNLERKKIDGANLEEIPEIYRKGCARSMDECEAMQYLKRSLEYIDSQNVVSEESVAEEMRKQFEAVGKSFLNAAKGLEHNIKE